MIPPRPPYKADLALIRENVPPELFALPQWVAWYFYWKAKAKAWAKIPLDPKTGKWAKTDDPTTWGTFDEAVALFEKMPNSAGVGFCFSPDDGLVGLDCDNSVTDRIINPYATQVAEAVNSYTEYSQSLGGIKILTIADKLPKGIVATTSQGKVELYSGGRFFALTGDRVDDFSYGIEKRHAEVKNLITDLSPAASTKAVPQTLAPVEHEAHLPALVKAMMRHEARPGENDGSKRLYTWCCRGVEMAATDAQIVQAIRAAEVVHPFNGEWSDDDILARVRDAEKVATRGNIETIRRNDRIELQTTAPNRLAEVFIGQRYNDGGESLLVRHGGEWHAYQPSTGYQTKESESLRAEIRGVADRVDVECVDKEGEPTGEFKPIRVTNTLINEIESACIRDNSLAFPTIVTGDRPQWLDGRTTPAAHRVIAFQNGLLDIDAWLDGRVELMPLTRNWFGNTVCPFPFDPAANTPDNWKSFLQTAWPDDEQQIRLLRQWMGYCLTSDTSLQKMLLLIGPKRSGKGTIARVLTHLIGRDNIAAPTLASFATNFGLWPLLKASLAIIGDARLNRSDPAIIERLLSITGEDSLTVDRKNLAPVTARIGARIMMLTNEVPRLADASGALSSRFVILQMTESHFGREDYGLTDRLIAESPGIILWALEGLRDLYQTGRFAESAAVAETLQELEDLSSPVRAFVRDCCEVKTGPRTTIADAFAAWQCWCEQEGRDPGQKNIFTRDLRSAFPQIKTSQVRTMGGMDESTQVRVLNGIRLKLAIAEAARVREAAHAS